MPHGFTTLLATLIAHGTKVGWATMADRVEERMTANHLQALAQGGVRGETRKAANPLLVDDLRSVPLSAVWGDGTGSSSDGQRFSLPASALLGALYPRYVGSYDRAVTVDTPGADHHRGFHPQGIAGAVREATAVVDGLLDNDTIRRPKEPFVDQPGYTAHLLGRCHLLGDSLMLRLTVSQQPLDQLDRPQPYGPLDAVFPGTVDRALLREQWAQLVRGAASLRPRTAPAPVMVTRLASSAPSDRLATALTA